MTIAFLRLASDSRRGSSRTTSACCTCFKYGRVDYLLAAVLKIGWRIARHAGRAGAARGDAGRVT